MQKEFEKLQQENRDLERRNQDLKTRLSRGKGYRIDLEQHEYPSFTYKDISNINIPALGTSTYDQNLIPGKFNTVYWWWETFTIPLMVCTAWITVFQIGFHRSSDIHKLNQVNLFLSLGLVFDLVLYIIVADHISLVHKSISGRSSRKWNAIQFLSLLPYGPLEYLFRGKHGIFTCILSLPKLLVLLQRFNQYFTRLEKHISFNYFWVRCLRLFCITFFMVHIGGCSYHLLADICPHHGRTWLAAINPEFKKSNIWITYIAAMYYSLTTFTTVGYGDFHSINHKEMILTCFFLLFNLIVAAYVTSNLANLVARGSNRTMDFRNNIEAMVSFLHENQVTPGLKDQILSQMCLRYKVEHLLLEELPHPIQRTINDYLFSPTIEKVYLFKGVSRQLKLSLMSKMKIEYLPPRVDVILQNEPPENIYIVVSGEIVIIRHGKQNVINTLKRWDIFGEANMFCLKPQNFTYRTRTVTQLLSLKVDDLNDAMQTMKKDKLEMMKNFIQYFEQLHELSTKASEADEERERPDRIKKAITFMIVTSTANTAFLEELLKTDVLSAAHEMLHSENEKAAKAKEIIDLIMNTYIKKMVQNDTTRADAGEMCSHIAEYVNEKMMLKILEELKSSEATIRSKTTYCVGVLCTKNDVAHKFYSSIWPSLRPLFREPELSDDAAVAVAKMMIHALPTSAKFDHVVLVRELLQVLPLKNDRKESEAVYQCIRMSVLQSDRNLTLSLASPLLKVFGEVLVSPFEPSEAKNVVRATFCHLVSIWGREKTREKLADASLCSKYICIKRTCPDMKKM